MVFVFKEMEPTKTRRSSPEYSIQYCHSTTEKDSCYWLCVRASNEEEFVAQPQKILYSALGLGLIFTVVLVSEKKVQQSELRLHNGKKKIHTVRAS